MGFRGAIKKGGGFLNNVDGELKDYEFSARFKDEKKDGEWVYFVPVIRTDGAEEDVDQHMFIGASERYEIDDDGKTLKMADGSPVTFGFTTPFGRFMDSLIEQGYDESELPDLEGGDPLNLETLIGERFRFKQEVDEEATKKFGKRVSGSGKNKREYDRTNTVIAAVLGKAGKGSSSKSSSKASGSKKAAKEDDEDDLESEAADVLKDVLAKESVNRKNLSLPVTKALMKNANKDALKKLILDEEWQEKQDWLSIDKKGNLSVEE